MSLCLCGEILPRHPIFINDAPHLFAPLRVRDFIEITLLLETFSGLQNHAEKVALYERLGAVIATLVEPELDPDNLTPRALLRLTHVIWKKSLGPTSPRGGGLNSAPQDGGPLKMTREQLELQVYQLSFLSKAPVEEILDFEVSKFNHLLKIWEAVWAKTLLDFRNVIAWPHVSGESGELLMDRLYKKLEALGGGPAPEILTHAEAAEALL